MEGRALSDSGYIDWHKLSRHPQWTPGADGQTFVYAFWLVDYGRAARDHGVTLLKDEGRHPDWFVHADRADQVLAAYCQGSPIVSHNFGDVFDHAMFARPLLASVLLGTLDGTLRDGPDRYWTCEPQHLDRRGQRLVKDLSMLYLRQPHIVTFIDVKPMKDNDPGVSEDTATVGAAPGLPPLQAIT